MRFQVHLQQFWPLCLYENRYKLPVKNNPFLAFQVHFYKIASFFTFQEHTKNIFFYYLHLSLIEKIIYECMVHQTNPHFT